jgi:hypothetical protein
MHMYPFKHSLSTSLTMHIRFVDFKISKNWLWGMVRGFPFPPLIPTRNQTNK